jgi:hypothetical protein
MSSMSSSLVDVSRQNSRKEDLLLPPPFPDKDLEFKAHSQNENVPPIEERVQRDLPIILKLGEREIPLLQRSRLKAIITGKMEGGYQFDKAEGEDTIIVTNPQGQEIGRLSLDSSKNEIDIRGDLQKGLSEIFEAEGLEVNQDLENIPKNNIDLEDIEISKKELFNK